MRAVRSLLAAAAVALLAGGCAGFGFVQPARELEFELTGRIAVRYRDDAGSGHVAWRHAAASDEVLLTSPLGQGIARIVRSGGEVALTTQDGQELRAADAESLTERALGFRLPLAGLADWVRGRTAAAPPPSGVRRDGAGRLVAFEQSGWSVEVLEYAHGLPSRLRLTYPGLELRLAISEWK